MSASNTTRDRRRPATSQPPRVLLGRRWRKATLTLHIVAAGAWIGIDVVVAVLVPPAGSPTTP